MAHKTTTGPGPKQGSKSAKPGREDRLKAALKANMARRKAQARARADGAQGQETPDQAGKPADK